SFYGLDNLFPDSMNLILGKDFKDFLHQQKAKHDPNMTNRLLHYTDTPRQKIKGINAILSIAPHENESTSEFSARLQKQIFLF
ncbi:unnamed protein product, partial [Absidia cylindrospora]